MNHLQSSHSRSATNRTGFLGTIIASRLGIVFAVAVTTAGCQFGANAKNADGVRLYEQGYKQAAVQRFQEALANNPHNWDAYYNLAATYHEVGKQRSDKGLLEEAEILYNRCLNLSPDNTDCYRALAALLVDTERPKKAFELLELWADRSPTLADPRVELARLHEEFGDNAMARRLLNQALEVNPSDARAWTALGHLREEQGRYAQALQNYQQAYNLNRGQPGLARRIGSLQQNLARADLRRSPSSTRTVQADTGLSPLQ